MAYTEPNDDTNVTAPPNPPMNPNLATEDLEGRLGGTSDLEAHAGPRMNPMLPMEHGMEEPAPQGPPPDGKQRFHNTMADFEHRAEANRAEMIGLDPSDPDYTKKLSALQAQHGALTTEKARYQMLHPWGGPESAHPGVLGKIGHVAGAVGNVVGNAVLGKGNMAEIPGSEASLEKGEHQGEAEIKGAGEGAQKAAQAGQEEAAAKETEARVPETQARTGLINQQTEELRNKPAIEPTLLQDYTRAVQDAISHGQDPSKSPVVQQLADSITGIQPQKAATEKTPPHITALAADGKSHIMERDPATGEYSIDRGVAPPNYAQVAPSLKTVDILNPQGIPTVQTLGGREIGPAATGAYGHEEAQAGAVSRAGTELISELRKPANREILGKLQSYVTKGTLGTPLADKQAAYLNSKLKTFAALQPALHGFRARTAQEAFEKMIGGLAQDPDATISAIQGILDTAGAINPGLNQGGNEAPAGGSRPSFAEWKSKQGK